MKENIKSMEENAAHVFLRTFKISWHGQRRGSHLVSFLYLLQTFKIDVLNNKTVIPDSWYSTYIATFLTAATKSFWGLTGSLMQPEELNTHHEVQSITKQHVKITATLWNVTCMAHLKHINGLYKRYDNKLGIRKLLRIRISKN